MTLDEQRRLDEEKDAVLLAAGVARSMKQIESMTVGRSRVSKTPIIDPRTLITKNQNPQQTPVPNNTPNDPLAPRISMIPLPKGMTMEDVLQTKPITQAPVLASTEIIPESIKEPSKQLELDFDRQIVLNDIYSQLDTLNSKIDIIQSSINKFMLQYNESSNNTTIIKKKSGTE